MSRKNFRDPETGEEFYIAAYSSSFKGGKMIHRDSSKKELVNELTGNVLEFIPRPKEEFGMPMMAKFNAKNEEGRQNIQDHFGSRATKFDTKGAGRDTKDQKQKDFSSSILERAKDGKL